LRRFQISEECLYITLDRKYVGIPAIWAVATQMSIPNFNQMEAEGEKLPGAKLAVKALVYKTLDAELSHLEQPVKEYFHRVHCEDRDTDHMILGSLYDDMTYHFYARPDTSAANIGRLIKEWLPDSMPDEIESAVRSVADERAATELDKAAQGGKKANSDGGSDGSRADEALKAPPHKATGRRGKRGLSVDDDDDDDQRGARADAKDAEKPGRRFSSRLLARRNQNL
jgi:hypothetical protein